MTNVQTKPSPQKKYTLRWKVAQSTELTWWKRYLKNKDKAAYLEWKKGYWNGLLEKAEEAIQLNEGDSILDAGCGPAGIFIVLDQYKVHALDPLLDKYEQTLEHFVAAEYPFVTFHSMPLEAFDTTQQFDTVFCMNAINHVSDLGKSFDLIAEKTKPGGYLVVTIDAHNFSGFKHLFRMIPGDILHPHQFDLKEYQDMLEKRDCPVISTVHLKHEFFFDHYMLISKRNG